MKQESYLGLYYDAHDELLAAYQACIDDIFSGKIEASPTVLVKNVIEAQNRMVNEQSAMIGMLFDFANGTNFDQPDDAQYFIDLINDSLSMNKELSNDVNARRRDELMLIRDELEQKRDAQVVWLSERTPRGRRIWRKLAK
jgi:hypothetical protein